MVVTFRMGEDPGPERMQQLVQAIRVLFDRIADQDKIFRDVAAALFAIGTNVPDNIDSWRRNGRKWRQELEDLELPALMLAVESMFENEWLGEDEDDAGQ